jgi:hypothetical protein
MASGGRARKDPPQWRPVSGFAAETLGAGAWGGGEVDSHGAALPVGNPTLGLDAAELTDRDLWGYSLDLLAEPSKHRSHGASAG